MKKGATPKITLIMVSLLSSLVFGQNDPPLDPKPISNEKIYLLKDTFIFQGWSIGNTETQYICSDKKKEFNFLERAIQTGPKTSAILNAFVEPVSNNCTTPLSYWKHPQFDAALIEILEDKNYKKLDLNILVKNDDYKFFHEDRDKIEHDRQLTLEEKRERIHYHNSRKVAHKVGQGANTLLIKGPADFIGEKVGHVFSSGADLATEKYDEYSNSSPKPIDKIKLKDFFPTNRRRIAIIKTGTGVSFIVLGVLGAGTAVVSGGISFIAAGAAGTGVGVLGAVLEEGHTGKDLKPVLDAHRARGGSVQGEDRRDSSSSRPSVRVLDRVGGTGATAGTEEIVNGVVSTALSEGVTGVLPFFGSYYQITGGLSDLKEAWRGSEKGMQFLLHDDMVTEKLITTYAENNKLAILKALWMAKELLRNGGGNGEAPPHFLKKVSDLCEALKWTEDFLAEARHLFKSNRDYTTKTMKRREQEKKIGNLAKGGETNVRHLQDANWRSFRYETDLILQNDELVRQIAKLKELKDPIDLKTSFDRNVPRLIGEIQKQSPLYYLWPKEYKMGPAWMPYPHEVVNNSHDLYDHLKKRTARLNLARELNQVLLGEFKKEMNAKGKIIFLQLETHAPKPIEIHTLKREIVEVDTAGGTEDGQVKYREYRKDIKAAKIISMENYFTVQEEIRNLEKEEKKLEKKKGKK